MNYFYMVKQCRYHRQRSSNTVPVQRMFDGTVNACRMQHAPHDWLRLVEISMTDGIFAARFFEFVRRKF